MSEIVKGILRAVSSGLQIPTIIILILLILLTIVMLGSFLAELITERKSLKLNIPKLVDDLQGKSTSEMKDVIASSSLLTRQKTAVQELVSRVTYPEDTREALARQLISDEEARYGKIVKITDLTARVAPMFGLMGTLIPLGPGLIALGEGDAATLSESLLIAFDTTVAGLISGAISFIVSGFRKGWYEEYMIGLETIMETVLDVQNTERRKAYQQKKAADAAKNGQAVSRDTVTMSRQQMQQATQAAAQARPAAPAQQVQMQHTQPQQAVRPAAPAQQAHQVQPQQAARPAAPAQPQMQHTQPQQAVRPAAPVQQAQPQQAARPAAPAQAQYAQPQQPAQTVTRQTLQGQAAQVTAKPSFAQANSKTIAGYDAQRLQEEVRAAEAAAMQGAERGVDDLDAQLQSLDDLLQNFAPTDGRQ